jgi:hypothetical protein
VYSNSMQTVVVEAIWDEEARVWVAESEDVPGLATGAVSFELLAEKLRFLVPELLEANHLVSGVNIQIQALRELVAAD